MKVSIKQYAQVLYELTLDKSEVEVNVVIEKFVNELIRNNQIKSASKIIEKFEEIYNQKNKIVVASVTSVSKLEGDYLERIKKYLMDRYEAKEVVLNNKVSPEIKGGIILRVGDEIIDGSVSNRLRSLKTKLTV
ncbi:MAG: ATP synthase F1 subunit delta [Candidatus Moranbacteria bacterium]|jgi:F-type H+-transporting ATPase subunit delta|nr:ATP synthase F1 subunit delta [Candidatus Moranbacteria bacterium]